MRYIIILVFCLRVFISSNAIAGSFEVAPTTLYLSPDSEAGVFYVTNRGTAPMVVQIEGYDWKQKNGKDELEQSKDLMISPPMANLQPGQKQTVRLAVKPDPTKIGERSFRLLASELPDPDLYKKIAGKKLRGINVLLQFSVPVFTYSEHSGKPKMEWSAFRVGENIRVTARNLDTKHVNLSEIFILTPKNKKIAVDLNNFKYILAGASHSWEVKAPEIAAKAVRIVARDKSSDEDFDSPLLIK